MNEVEDILREEAELKRKLAELRQRRALLASEENQPAKKTQTNRPLRETMLDLLSEARVPLNSLLIASILRPLQGKEVPATRFGTLSIDEQKSYDTGRPKPVYLCHCLTYDQGQAMKRFWARSDWPLKERIMGPMTGRLLFLCGAAWAIRLAEKQRHHAVDAQVLDYVAADQARNAGLKVQRGVFDYAEWLLAIEEQINLHLEEDIKVRQEASERLAAQLNDSEQLFGARAPLTLIPGSTKHWRSSSE